MNVKKLLKPLKHRSTLKYLVSGVFFALLLLAYGQWSQQPKTIWEEDRVEIGLRMVGDQVMKKHGDGQTPIPPIVQLSDYDFELRLPQAIALDPDALAEVALKTFDDSHFQKAVVQVFAGDSPEMVYGFEIDTRDQPSVPCLGRILSTDHYQVMLKVQDLPVPQTQLQLAMMSVAGFGLLVMMLTGLSGLSRKTEDPIEVSGMKLDVEKGLLSYRKSKIQLTQKEASLVLLLMKNVGNLVTREYLTEEVWAKDGVITGRSLDVFISRLRKKIAIHPGLQIRNEHGKGYVLEVKS